MDANEFLSKMKAIEMHLLDYIANDDENNEENHQKLEQFLHQNYDDANSLERILLLLSKISNNHHRSLNFFKNIEQIFLMMKNDIINYFPSEQIFNIFYENKRMILLLIKNGIITLNQSLATSIISSKYATYHYQEYLYPELKQIMPNIQQFEGYDEDEHDKKRCLGENDSFICTLIRNDSIEDFISHVNRTNLSFSSKIEPSIYETNSFLIFNQPTLIEYAAFFGSIQIFKYIQMNGVEFYSKLWDFSIHSNNAELICLLEENGIRPEPGFIRCFIKESLKCHHNAITQYLIDNYSIQNSMEKNDFLPSVQYYNFCFFPTNFTDKFVFYDLCAYNYPIIVKDVLEKGNFDANYKKIQKNQLFESCFKKILFFISFKINFFLIVIQKVCL